MDGRRDAPCCQLQVKKLVNAAYERARNILMNNRDELEALASELLDKESLTGAQVRPPAGCPPTHRSKPGTQGNNLSSLGPAAASRGQLGPAAISLSATRSVQDIYACRTTHPVSVYSAQVC
jgi:Peptidase family M41